MPAMLRAASSARLLARLQGVADAIESSQQSASFVSDALRLAAGSCLSQGARQPAACSHWLPSAPSSSTRQQSGGQAAMLDAPVAAGRSAAADGFGSRRFTTGPQYNVGPPQQGGQDPDGVIQLIADEEDHEAVRGCSIRSQLAPSVNCWTCHLLSPAAGLPPLRSRLAHPTATFGCSGILQRACMNDAAAWPKRGGDD